MKKTKVIIPALGLLLLSTAASVTGTVAWFSMNNTASVSGMQISVNSNATYLLISNANTGDTAPANAAAIQAENSNAGFTTLTFTDAATELYPVAPAASFTAAQGNTPASHTEYVAGANVSDPQYWYTMIGTNATAAGYVGRTGTEALVSDLSGYVLKHTFYFTIASGANGAVDLLVDSVTISGDTAVRCLVVGTNGSALYSATSDTDSIVLENELDSTTIVSVNVYLYYDGNADTIYTNNMANIADTTVDLTFSVTTA